MASDESPSVGGYVRGTRTKLKRGGIPLFDGREEYLRAKEQVIDKASGCAPRELITRVDGSKGRRYEISKTAQQVTMYGGIKKVCYCDHFPQRLMWKEDDEIPIRYRKLTAFFNGLTDEECLLVLGDYSYHVSQKH